MKTIFKIAFFCAISFVALVTFTGCKKDKLITDSGAKLQFSQDSVLFDTVFTTIGSATKNIRIRNKNNQRIKISSIELQGGSSSSFIINVDGTPGVSFEDLEIAAHDSIYIFIQVHINPNSGNSPAIVSDAINFTTNGNKQTVKLEAWGQNAYYHYPTDAIKFKDGSYLAYSRISQNDNAVVTWANDKPHVIYSYLVVDSSQTLYIQPGVRIYMNYKAGLWVYQYGEIHINGQKGNEVTFQGARREQDYADEPGQWDRIWINEGSDKNEIDYAIIKNGYIGVQAENIGKTIGNTTIIDTNATRHLKITNTKIQNMSLWGFYALNYNVYGGNNVFSNCQENSLKLELGGKYTFIHCTFANFWDKDTPRDKPAVSIVNHIDSDVWPMDSIYFGNCVVCGKLVNEINLDLNYTNSLYQPRVIFSNCWLRTTNDTSDPNIYINVRKGDNLDFADYGHYNLAINNTETQVTDFVHPKATTDALKFSQDINMIARNTTSVTAGAYIVNGK